MKKIDNYLNYIFSDYENNPKAIEVKSELKINLLEKVKDYQNEGLSEEKAIEQAIESIGDLDEIFASFDLKDTEKFYSEKLNEYLTYISASQEKELIAKKSASIKIALGVFLIIVSLSFTTYFEIYLGDKATIMLFIAVAISVPLFVIAGFEITNSEIKHDFDEDEIDLYKKERKVIALKESLIEENKLTVNKARIFLISGISFVILSIIFPILFENEIGNSLMLGVVAISVAMIIYGGMNMMNAKAIASDNFLKEERIEETTDNISSIIMLIALLIYLLLGFLMDAWHPGWVVFPIAGVLVAIFEVAKKNKREK